MNSLFLDALPPHQRELARLAPRSVNTIDLDSYFAGRKRLPRVVKIDIEGAEFSALRGAERILASGATVFCELHPDAWQAAGHTHSDLENWLKARGRIVVDLRTGNRVDGNFTYGPYLLAIDPEPI